MAQDALLRIFGAEWVLPTKHPVPPGIWELQSRIDELRMLVTTKDRVGKEEYESAVNKALDLVNAGLLREVSLIASASLLRA